ncbi:hypothetical protein V8G54_023356 [Vigna mungo]|uniref:Uncharacterized protein n=1 Tax=Vigna mungo TaxID=3915 RepID=A0AAQ3N300_VIGMU
MTLSAATPSQRGESGQCHPSNPFPLLRPSGFFELLTDDGRGIEANREYREGVHGLQFFVNGIRMGRRDTVALFFLVSFLSVAYGFVGVGIISIYYLLKRVLVLPCNLVFVFASGLSLEFNVGKFAFGVPLVFGFGKWGAIGFLL